MNTKNSPDYDVLISKQLDTGAGGETTSMYTRVGAGWKVAKNGISITLDALPLGGKLVLFPYKARVSETESKSKAEGVF